MSAMQLTCYGHSCFAVETGGKRILFDPFITPNSLASHVKLKEIRADYILISHGHFDHIADAVELSKSTGALVVSNFEIVSWLEKQGVRNLHPMNHGGARAFDFGRAKYVSAIHSSVLPDGTYGGNPGGFVIQNAEGSFYFAGDTALTLDMKLTGEEFTLRFAVLPIGDNFTMGAKDAAKACGLLNCRVAVGVHYDTFPPIKIDRAEALAAFDEAGVTLHLPEIGGTLEL